MTGFGSVKDAVPARRFSDKSGKVAMTQNVPKEILVKYGLQNRDVYEHIVKEEKLVMALKRARGYVLHPHMDSREDVLKMIDDAIFGK